MSCEWYGGNGAGKRVEAGEDYVEVREILLMTFKTR
jgi:hypothetical protein